MRKNRTYRHSSERRVWVFSELNPDLNPKDIARILASAALEAAAAGDPSKRDEEPGNE